MLLLNPHVAERLKPKQKRGRYCVISATVPTKLIRAETLLGRLQDSELHLRNAAVADQHDSKSPMDPSRRDSTAGLQWLIKQIAIAGLTLQRFPSRERERAEKVGDLK
jgi:hypothetical protein